MRYTQIAVAKPFEGAPKINLADVFGASPKKPIILKIPATGKRPITYSAVNLPEGLTLADGIITGQVEFEGNYEIELCAENILGKMVKKLTLEIKENTVLLTPLMGFSSWNAFGENVSQEKMLGISKKMIELGICEYGYSYINIDSGWQKEYGGEFDAIMPNEKFPDMKKMCDEIHSLGLKCGIYSTPMLTAWGCPKELPSIPGCTVGEPDHRFSLQNGGIGTVRKEKNNALQWARWGFDYLKYDWRPTDPYNAELMRTELIKTDRDFGFCVTVMALPEYHDYWERYCNSFRCSADSHGNWEILLKIYKAYENFIAFINKGHFYDMDMLDVGTCELCGQHSTFDLTEDEMLISYTMRAFFNSPLQISSTLENVSDFELSMYCNEEIIAINQDSSFSSAKPVMVIEKDRKIVHVYKKLLSDGNYALAVFNLGEEAALTEIFLEEDCMVRDVWLKEDMGIKKILAVKTQPHTVRVFKIINC